MTLIRVIFEKLLLHYGSNMGYLHDHKKKTSKELSVPLPTTITFGLWGVLLRDDAFAAFILRPSKSLFDG